MNTIVTGGAGFIGSNLAKELESQGHEVTVMDDFSSGHDDNLKGFKGKVMKQDVSKPFTIEEDVDAIFHIATITDPRYDDDKELL